MNLKHKEFPLKKVVSKWTTSRFEGVPKGHHHLSKNPKDRGSPVKKDQSLKTTLKSKSRGEVYIDSGLKEGNIHTIK